MTLIEAARKAVEYAITKSKEFGNAPKFEWRGPVKTCGPWLRCNCSCGHIIAGKLELIAWGPGIDVLVYAVYCDKLCGKVYLFEAE